ncbi:hypothetical protein T484DRAFT_1877957, partial [Baffinella frigidus]
MGVMGVPGGEAAAHRRWVQSLGARTDLWSPEIEDELAQLQALFSQVHAREASAGELADFASNLLGIDISTVLIARAAASRRLTSLSSFARSLEAPSNVEGNPAHNVEGRGKGSYNVDGRGKPAYNVEGGSRDVGVVRSYNVEERRALNVQEGIGRAGGEGGVKNRSLKRSPPPSLPVRRSPAYSEFPVRADFPAKMGVDFQNLFAGKRGVGRSESPERGGVTGGDRGGGGGRRRARWSDQGVEEVKRSRALRRLSLESTEGSHTGMGGGAGAGGWELGGGGDHLALLTLGARSPPKYLSAIETG